MHLPGIKLVEHHADRDRDVGVDAGVKRVVRARRLLPAALLAGRTRRRGRWRHGQRYTLGVEPHASCTGRDARIGYCAAGPGVLQAVGISVAAGQAGCAAGGGAGGGEKGLAIAALGEELAHAWKECVREGEKSGKVKMVQLAEALG